MKRRVSPCSDLRSMKVTSADLHSLPYISDSSSEAIDKDVKHVTTPQQKRPLRESSFMVDKLDDKQLQLHRSVILNESRPISAAKPVRKAQHGAHRISDNSKQHTTVLGSARDFKSVTPEVIASASPTELREMLTDAVEEIAFYEILIGSMGDRY